jgi:N-acetylmuramoyl-L-alanine amidase
VIKPLQQPVAIRLLATALAALSATTTLAQSPTPPLNRNVVVLDPAHGGTDGGAAITPNLPEKQFTLTFAGRLRTLLTNAGFTVISTREADPPGLPSSLAPTLTPDQRAGTANHVRALACILIHATPNGSAGAHLFTSTLTPSDEPADPTTPIPWKAAQTPYLPLSLRLANQLGLSLIHANIPTILSPAPIRPIDNLTCPAIALELAPLNSTPLTDATYQQHAAQAITAALIAWRNQQPAPPPAPKPPPPAPTPAPAPEPTPAPPTGAAQ